MRKPNNYESTQAQGEFTPVELGGHTLVIKQVLLHRKMQSYWYVFCQMWRI